MQKYLSVFKISWEQEFAYKLNFVMWRLRNVLQIFVAYFLWTTIFENPERIVFGYDRAKILTYVFGIIIVRAFVLSAKANEIAGEISRGEILGYLVKPVNYIKYWLTRDLSSKLLNLIFAFFETVILFFIFKPPFFLQSNPLLILSFAASLIIAMLIYFELILITSSTTFWMPEAAWGSQFLITVIITEFLSGAMFPLDILPHQLQNTLSLTPFPYLIFFPLQVYLGKIPSAEIAKGLGLSFIWLIVLWKITKLLWQKGLKAYEAYGR